jgi:hypothetical protein
MSGLDAPGIDVTGASGGPRDNPLIPCHECGAEERFLTMKRSDEWRMQYLQDGSGEWIAVCPECDPNA